MRRASTPIRLEPITLEGKYVRLEPLGIAHHAGLAAVGLDPSLWRWTTPQIRTAEDLRRYIETAIREREDGRSLPFATHERESGRAVGSTRFANFEPTHRRVEIGWTWIAPPWQRTAINTEAKYLMLCHAFETLGCMRVELKTHARNQRSRDAMLRIGAREEGTFRKHMVMEDGTIRDSVYFSIVDDEWHGVKARLERMLDPRPGR